MRGNQHVAAFSASVLIMGVGAFVLFVVLSLLLASFGIAIEWLGVPDAWSFALLVVTGVIIIRLLYRPNLLRKLIPRTLRESRPTVTD